MWANRTQTLLAPLAGRLTYGRIYLKNIPRNFFSRDQITFLGVLSGLRSSVPCFGTVTDTAEFQTHTFGLRWGIVEPLTNYTARTHKRLWAERGYEFPLYYKLEWIIDFKARESGPYSVCFRELCLQFLTKYIDANKANLSRMNPGVIRYALSVNLV